MQIDVETAIKISRIIAYCPEERLPMILDVFNKAEIDIDGLDELVVLKTKSKLGILIDTEDFVAEVKELGKERNGEILIDVATFNEFCKKKNIQPRLARKHLYQEGYIRAIQERRKVVYSVPMYENGKNTRYVVFKNRDGDL
ncbi:MAG: hypothetical protein ACI4VF_04870 [Lachnospirales bacterium]